MSRSRYAQIDHRFEQELRHAQDNDEPGHGTAEASSPLFAGATTQRVVSTAFAVVMAWALVVGMPLAKTEHIAGAAPVAEQPRA